jgi:hypothetical protein
LSFRYRTYRSPTRAPRQRTVTTEQPGLGANLSSRARIVSDRRRHSNTPPVKRRDSQTRTPSNSSPQLAYFALNRCDKSLPPLGIATEQASLLSSSTRLIGARHLQVPGHRGFKRPISSSSNFIARRRSRVTIGRAIPGSRAIRALLQCLESNRLEPVDLNRSEWRLILTDHVLGAASGCLT